MTFTPSITFRGLERSEALESEIHARVRKLATYYRSINGCHVLVELLQRHHAIGNHYHVRVELAVPGEDLVVAHDASLHATARDIHIERARKADEADPERKHARVAIHEAFDIARRRLQDYARRQRGAVKVPKGRRVAAFQASPQAKKRAGRL